MGGSSKIPDALGRLFALNSSGHVELGHPIILMLVIKISDAFLQVEDVGVKSRGSQPFLMDSLENGGERFDGCLTSARFGQGLISPKLWFPMAKNQARRNE
jgi:hypothetical protein